MYGLSSFIVANITIIFLGVLSYYLNSYSNSGIYFGVRIPNKFKELDEIKFLEKEYKKLILISFSVVIVLFNIIMFLGRRKGEGIASLVLGVTLIVALLIHGLVFVIYNKKTKKIKKEKNLNYIRNNVVIVDTTLRKAKKDERYKPLKDWLYLSPIVIPIVLLFLTFSKKEYLYELGLNKIYNIPIIGMLMCMFMYVLAKISLKSKVDLNSLNREKIIIKKKKIKKYISIFFLLSEVEVILLYSIVQLGIIYEFYTVRLINYIIGSSDREDFDEVNKCEDYRDDDDNWIWGMFYFNKNDPTFMIEKRVGIGYTVNFANKKSWILFAFIIAFIILMSFV